MASCQTVVKTCDPACLPNRRSVEKLSDIFFLANPPPYRPKMVMKILAESCRYDRANGSAKYHRVPSSWAHLSCQVQNQNLCTSRYLDCHISCRRPIITNNCTGNASMLEDRLLERFAYSARRASKLFMSSRTAFPEACDKFYKNGSQRNFMSLFMLVVYLLVLMLYRLRVDSA